MNIEQKLLNLGYKVWEKGEENTTNYKKRIYINDLMELAAKLNVNLDNPKALRKSSMYYDCLTGKFFFNATSSRISLINMLIDEIRR